MPACSQVLNHIVKAALQKSTRGKQLECAGASFIFRCVFVTVADEGEKATWAGKQLEVITKQTCISETMHTSSLWRLKIFGLGEEF